MNKGGNKLFGRFEDWKKIAFVVSLFCFTISAHAAKQTFNAKDMDIRALIETVSRITGKTIIIDPRVKNQKVTILSQEPLSEDEIYDTFLSVLRVHGFSAVQTGKVTKIVQDQTAKSDYSPVVTDNNSGFKGDKMITRIVKVKNTDASQLVSVLRTLIPQQGHFAVYRPTNVLIIHDRAANIERIVKIIGQVDKASNEEIEIINLEHAAASEVVRILESLSKKTASKGKTATSGTQPRFVADERTNSILLTADNNTRLKMRSIIAHLDTPLESTGNTQVFYLKYADGKDLVQVLTGVVESIGQEKKAGASKSTNTRRRSSNTNKDFNIEAHEATNSLVVTATPDVMRSIEGVIRQLDIARHQVMVEAIIAELSEDFTRRLGIQWLFGGDGTAPAGVIGGDADGVPIAAIAGAALSENEDALAQALSGIQGITAGVGNIVDGSFSFAALIEALAADTDTNLLSTPSLMTMDNEEASISVGEQLPIITGSTLGSNNSNPFTQVSRQDVGVKLKVTPQINEGTAVKLQIEQEVSAQSGATSVDITIRQRKINTTVLVPDGQIIVLGGLIDDSINQSQTKVPLLGDIPLIGNLFRTQSSRIRKNNLVVFLRPTIIKDRATMNSISSQKYNYIRGLQMKTKAEGVNLFFGAEHMVLPEIDEVLTLPPTFEETQAAADGEEDASTP
ncbi:MAG: type II secretion system secretin GspD [Pseudomonadota bacterium]